MPSHPTVIVCGVMSSASEFLFIGRRNLKERREADKPCSKRYAATVLSIISAVFCVLTVVGIVVFQKYLTDAELVRAWVEDNYLLGAVGIILICAVQVIVALIPGEAVEIACGYVFGAWGGALICSLGILLGSVSVIILVRRFGRRFVEAFYPKEKIDSLPVLNDPKKRNTVTFLLFLIPGTPKDLLTYIVGLTNMSIPLYIALTMVARFPSIIISTMGGDAVGDGRFLKAVIVFIIAAVISGVGYLCYLFLQKSLSAKSNKKNKK